MKDFIAGFGYNLKGFKYFLQNKSLWKYSIIPLILNILATGLLLSLFFAFFEDIFNLVSSPLGTLDVQDPTTFLWKILDGALWLLRFLLQVLVFILSLVLLVVFVFVLSSIVNGPFYEMMADAILIKEGLREDKPFVFRVFLTELVHSLKVEGLKILLYIMFTFGLMVLSLIPVLGIFFSLFGFFFTCWYFAFNLSTYPMILIKKPFSEILLWGRQRKLKLVGFGVPATIPFLGILLMNFQVVGGTLLYVNEQKN